MTMKTRRKQKGEKELWDGLVIGSVTHGRKKIETKRGERGKEKNLSHIIIQT